MKIIEFVRNRWLGGARPYINPYLGGVLLGIVLFLSFAFTTNGLGASGGLNRVVVALEDMAAPEHIDRTAYLLEMAGGDTNPLDNWTVILLAGTVLGGAFAGLWNGRMRIETYMGPRIKHKQVRWLWALLGGAIMGYGARLARGCTSGQALSGGAVLSVGSWVFMFAVFGGAYAVAWFVRRNWIKGE